MSRRHRSQNRKSTHSLSLAFRQQTINSMAGGSKQLVLCTLAAALLFGSYLATMASAQNFKQEDLDFADAEEDPVTGQLCITRKYCPLKH